MTTHVSLKRALVVALCLGLLVVALGAMTASAASTFVTPSSPDGWAVANKRVDANAFITSTEPRDGLGSLEFLSNAVTGGSPSQDKVDFEKLWITPPVAGRTLGNLTKVAYEFYRDSSSTTASHLVPVFRLPFYHDMAPLENAGPEDYTGYLIWEAIYNGYPAPGGVPTDQWVSQDLTLQKFWMFLTSGPGGTGVVQNYNVTLSEWITANPQGISGDPVAPDLNANTLIYGVNVGIGSGWGFGKKFQGFVDNVVVEFGSDVVSANFEPNPVCTDTCYVDDTGSDANGGTSPTDAFKTIQKAIDTVQTDGQVRVLPGNYFEKATGRDVLGSGNHQFGLYFNDGSNDGVTLVGVTADDEEILDPAQTEAVITTNATNNFGYSGIFVEADEVTIAGVEIGDNTPGNNKTIEVIGDGFTFKNSFMNVSDGGSLYFGDWRFNTGANTSYIQTYTVDNNIFSDGSSVDISSGAGYSGPETARLITNNQFEFSLAMYTASGNSSWPNVSFNGDSTEIPWYTYPMSGATIKGNTFHNEAPDGRHIRARGIADDSTFDWESYWNDNTFNKAVVAGPALFGDVRAFTYSVPDTGPAPNGYCDGPTCEFYNVRQIGATIQPEIDHAQSGDTVLVAAGAYFENATTDWRDLYINKSLNLQGAGSGQTIIQLPEKTNGLEIFGNGLSVTLKGLTFTKLPANTNAAGFNIRVAETTSSFTNLTFDDVESAYASGRNVMLGGAGTFDSVTVNGSNFHHAGSWGFSTAGVVKAMTVTNSHFDNNGRIDLTHGIGFDLEGGGGSSNVVITGGTFNNNGSINTNGSKGINIAEATNLKIDGIEAKGNFDGIIIWEWAGTTSDVEIVNSNVSANRRGITFGSETGKTIDDVLITGNILKDNLEHGVQLFRAAGWGDGTITDVVVSRNDLSGNPASGITYVMPYEEVDGTCNWWGAANGPGPVGPGSGAKVSAGVDFAPWLLSSDLDGPCVGGMYEFAGFFSPIEMGARNVVKAGQTVPVKWRLTSEGQPVSDPASFVKLYSYEVNCDTAAKMPTEEVETVTGGSGLQYLGDGYWQWNWKTIKSYSGQCREMYVAFADGTTSPTVWFNFSK